MATVERAASRLAFPAPKILEGFGTLVEGIRTILPRLQRILDRPPQYSPMISVGEQAREAWSRGPLTPTELQEVRRLAGHFAAYGALRNTDPSEPETRWDPNPESDWLGAETFVVLQRLEKKK